jgi:uncharacterized protein
MTPMSRRWRRPHVTPERIPRAALIAYLVLTFALSSAWYFLIVTRGGMGKNGGYVLALMWSPALAAFATQLATHRTLRGLGWRWPSGRWVGLAYFLPIAYSIVAYGAVWLAGLGAVDLARAPQKKLAFVVVGGLIAFAAATGEEIGWRGFLVPALLRRWSLIPVGVVSGLIWALWHLPLVVFADYRSGTPLWYAIPCFTIGILGLALIMAWLRLKSGSFWPAAILHASHNQYVQGLFDRVTVDTGVTRWLTGEFGIGLAATLVLTAALFFRRSAIREDRLA